MINRRLVVIMDQQAPPAALHSCEVVVQTLSMKAHRKSGGTIFQRKNRVTTVRSELNHPLKMLLLAHPITPTLVTGGFSSSLTVSGKDASMAHYLSTRATLLLYQFIKADVDRLKIR